MRTVITAFSCLLMLFIGVSCGSNPPNDPHLEDSAQMADSRLSGDTTAVGAKHTPSTDSCELSIRVLRYKRDSNAYVVRVDLLQMREAMQQLGERKLFPDYFQCGVIILFLIVCGLVLIVHKQNLKLNRLGQRLHQQRQPAAPRTNAPDPERLGRLEERLHRLEESIRRLSERPSVVEQHPAARVSVSTAAEECFEVQPKEMYFGAVCGREAAYFKELLPVKGLDARFSARVTGDYASFAPLEVRDVTSFDYMKSAVTITGQRNGSRMKVIEDGEARCRDGKWVIVQMATVELF